MSRQAALERRRVEALAHPRLAPINEASAVRQGDVTPDDLNAATVVFHPTGIRLTATAWRTLLDLAIQRYAQQP